MLPEGFRREMEVALGKILATYAARRCCPAGSLTIQPPRRIVTLFKRMKPNPKKFADRFGLDARTIQDWERERRVLDQTVCMMLTMIDYELDLVCVH